MQGCSSRGKRRPYCCCSHSQPTQWLFQEGATRCSFWPLLALANCGGVARVTRWGVGTRAQRGRGGQLLLGAGNAIRVGGGKLLHRIARYRLLDHGFTSNQRPLLLGGVLGMTVGRIGVAWLPNLDNGNNAHSFPPQVISIII